MSEINDPHIHTLLVIPSDDLRGMLDEGACGFQPPRAWRKDWETDEDGETWPAEPQWFPARSFTTSAKHALVLRWQGGWMPHGWITAGMACGWPPSICLPLTLTPQRRFLVSLEARGCTLIALDKQGKEMTDD